MKVSIIVAMDQKRGIGKQGGIPWHISEDFRRFKKITTGHIIIMGRKTYESIGRHLPNRLNIIITRDAVFDPHKFCSSKKCDVNVFVYHSLEEAIDFTKTKDQKEIFIIGGGQIYEQAIKKGLVDKLYLTLVDGSFDADTFFPDYSEFKKVIHEESKGSEGYKYKFLKLERG